MKKPVVRDSRSRERVTTLVEVLIVVAIIAMVAGGVGVAAFEYWLKAKQKTTAMDARAVRNAVRAWRTDHDAAGRPKFDELRRAAWTTLPCTARRVSSTGLSRRWLGFV